MMSRYTVELRHLISQNYDLGLEEYPIFDEAYRNVLNQKILDHYRYHEIGFETPAQFKHYLNTTLNEIMGPYNVLYKLELDKMNPFDNVDYTETYERKADGKTDTTGQNEIDTTRGTRGTTTQESDNDLFTVESDTPAGMISVGDIKSHTWASGAQMGENKTTDTTNLVQDEQAENISQSSGNILTNNTEDYTRHVLGYTGNKTRVELINQYANNLINIDLMIIKDLRQLFMGVF